MKLKHVFGVLCSLVLAFTAVCVPVKAAGTVYAVDFYAKVTDAGQYVSAMTIDYGNAVDAASITKDTYTVHMTSIVDYGTGKGAAYKYYDATKALKVVGVSVSGSVVTVRFDMSQAPTLTYLAEARNYPGVLGFTVDANTIATKTSGGTTINVDAEYSCKATSYKDLKDDEVSQFTGVTDKINYQFHKGTNDSLIVWFHGNGEGDLQDSSGNMKLTGNNIAQVLANRGAVAWVGSDAQKVFGDASVIAFQAPSMWYYATRDELLKEAYTEIEEIVKDNKIDPNNIYVAGCSAGGFMSTRMIIAYPDLFKAAMLSAPALDIANFRSGLTDATPTDDELKQLLNSKTAIWLVQAETDSAVNPENCSKRIWNILSAGKTVTSKDYTQENASGFTTYETADNKYKLSLYQTADTADFVDSLGTTRKKGVIEVAEDYDQDGTNTMVKYNDHWSWIYTLTDNPDSALGGHVWEWAKSYTEDAYKQKMYRLYNPNSGEHFYTGSVVERDSVVKAGWNLEGIGWYAPTSSNTPVYRLYNPNAGDHHYTMNWNEKEMLVSVGWTDEGIGWYSDDAKGVELYREYNPNAKSGAHNYTADQNENDYLVKAGWQFEGTAWYGMN